MFYLYLIFITLNNLAFYNAFSNFIIDYYINVAQYYQQFCTVYLQFKILLT